MTKANSLDPPKLATWLMEQFSPLLRNPPLAGDLVEGFKEGRSSGWYWRQVFWAILIGLLNLFRKRWGPLAYAVACGGLICTAWFSIFPVFGRYTAYQFAVTCGGQVLSSPVQVGGPALRSQQCSLFTQRATESHGLGHWYTKSPFLPPSKLSLSRLHWVPILDLPRF